MAWIESHQSLANHRKTMALEAELEIDTAQAVGHLHLLWWWALDNVPTGDLTGVPNEILSRAAKWRGDATAFVVAMIHSGFIDPNPRHLHNWEDYSGRLVARRELNTKRMRERRSSKLSTPILTALSTPNQPSVTPNKPPMKQAAPKISVVAMKLADELRLLILANHPTAKVPEVPTAWAEDINRMLHLDKRKVEDVKAVIAFCQHDSFWQANILSGKKLREKYDQLYLKMRSNGTGVFQSRPQPGSVPSDAEIDEKERRLGLTKTV